MYCYNFDVLIRLSKKQVLTFITAKLIGVITKILKISSLYKSVYYSGNYMYFSFIDLKILAGI